MMKTVLNRMLESVALCVYSVTLYAATPLLLWRLYRRSQTQPAYFQRKRERWGWGELPTWQANVQGKSDGRQSELSSTPKILWIHAVSVGETLAARPLIERLLQRSDYRLVITCSTPTGSEQIQRVFAEALTSGQAFHTYAPYDTPKAVKRFLRRIQPDAYLILETELWPNTLKLCAKRGISSYLVNARLSEKSARAYAKVGWMTRPMLRCLHQVFAQSAIEGQRFEALGLASEQWQVTGSIKLDVSLSQPQRQQVERWRSQWGLLNKPVLITASTHPTEEALILQAWLSLKSSFPEAVLILAPRHIDRINEIESEINLTCAQQTFIKRSEIVDSVSVDVILVDTLGELGNLFGLASVAIMGGTFVERGGHNFVEPALWKVPTVCGFSDFNFADISRQLQTCHFLKSVDASPSAIAQTVSHWWRVEHERDKAGNAGEAWVAQNRGALQKVLEVLEKCL